MPTPSVDQALLLQSLLEVAGHEATLATRTLTPAEAKTVLDAFVADASAVPTEAARADLGAAAGLALSESDAKALSEAIHQADAEAVTSAVSAAKRVAPELLATLGKRLTPRRLTAPRQHVWVEIKGEALDPILPEQDRTGQKSLDPRGLERLRNTLVVSLVMQRTRAGKAEEETLLRVPIALDLVAWAPLELTLRPELDVFKGAGPNELAKRLGDAKVLRANLLVGDKRHGAAAFDRQGVRYEVAADGSTAGPAALGAALGGGLGGFGGGGGRPRADGPVVFQAVVLRLEVKGPGEGTNPERVHERALLTAKPDQLPFVRVSLLVDNATLLPGERERSTPRALAAMKPAYDALVAGRGDLASLAGDPREPLAVLMAFGDLRREVQARLATPKQQHLRERTSLIAVVDRMRPSSNRDGTLTLQRHFDLIANPVTFVGRDGVLDASAAVALGVADTALEAALLGPDSDAARAATAWSQLASPSGAPTIEKDRGLLRVAWSDAAWWSIDPRSGTTVGRVPGGGGQAMFEYAYQTASKACDWGWILSFVSAGQPGNAYYVNDVDTWASRFCAVVKGTGMQQYQMEQIGKIQSALWTIALPALRGVPNSKGGDAAPPQ